MLYNEFAELEKPLILEKITRNKRDALGSRIEEKIVKNFYGILLLKNISVHARDTLTLEEYDATLRTTEVSIKIGDIIRDGKNVYVVSNTAEPKGWGETEYFRIFLKKYV